MANVQNDFLLSDYRSSLGSDTKYRGLVPDQRPPAEKISVGKPKAKDRINAIDLAALIGVWICFVLGVVTVNRNVSLGWSLGYNNQLIVVGFLLSLQILFLARLLPSLLVKIEARFGSSCLQNFDMLLRYSLFSKNAELHWRLILLMFTLLPIGLSIGYKRFPGGESTFGPGKVWGTSITQSKLSAGRIDFGVNPPPGVPVGNLFAMINSTIPFISASANDSTPPPFDSLPQAYGFNSVLLSNTSAAVFDAPTPANITSIQHSLPDGGTSWTIEADVSATVSNYNTSTDQLRTDTSWWESIIGNGIFIDHFYNAYEAGLLTNEGYGDNSWAYLGIIPSRSDPPKVIDPLSMDNFRQAALLFTTRRELCHGKWTIRRNDVSLDSGSCNGTALPPAQQAIITDNQLILGTRYMPVIGSILRPYSVDRAESLWAMPTYVMTTAAMYWSEFTEKGQLVPSASPTIQTVTRSVMRDSAGLYVILVIVPVLTTLCAGASMLLHGVPIGSGFGMIAILAGLNRESAQVLRGAALSGELERRLRLQIGVEHALGDEGASAGRVEYVIDGRGRNGTLKGGEVIS
ncbi:MAG: hypothetical protein M1828_002427 [Chrysothrix sp. TS-e1954]|nr:MAG: hypothetical protein M1828_002427 [Chrysothrix sp. TS-e1954]